MGEYLPLDPDKITAAMPHAQINPAVSGDATIRFTDYVQPGDSMLLTLNSHSRLANQILIGSSLDKKPVSFTVDFMSLANGVSYPSTTDAKWEAEHLEVRVTTLDYHK